MSESDRDPKQELERLPPEALRAIWARMSDSVPTDWTTHVPKGAQVSDVEWTAKTRPTEAQQEHERELERRKEDQRAWEVRHNWWAVILIGVGGMLLLAVVHFLPPAVADPAAIRQTQTAIAGVFGAILAFIAGRASKT